MMKSKKEIIKSKTDTQIIDLDVSMARNFDITPFLWGLEGIDLINIVLKSKDLSFEFRNEFYKNFIESLLDSSQTVDGIGYFIRKIPISISLNNWYKGNFKISKSDLLKGVEKKISKSVKKFEKLSEEERIEEAKITIEYMGYSSKVDGLKCKLTHMTDRRIDAENVNLVRLFTQIVNSSSEEQQNKFFNSSTLFEIFEYYAENTIEFCKLDAATEKNKIAIAKNFCKIYKFFGYQKNGKIDKMLSLSLSLIPDLTIDSLYITKNFDLMFSFISKILDNPKYDEDLKVFCIERKIDSLIELKGYDDCKEIIKKYLPNVIFKNVLKKAVELINKMEINKYFDDEEEWNAICEKLDIKKPEFNNAINLFCTEDSIGTFLPKGPIKDTIYCSLIKGNKVSETIQTIFESPLNHSIYLDFILDHIHICPDPKIIFKLFKLLQSYSLDIDQKDKIKDAKALYKIKLKAEREFQKFLKDEVFAKVSDESSDEDLGKDEEKSIDYIELAKEAEIYIQQNIEAETYDRVTSKKEEDINVLIHKAYQIQKKLVLELPKDSFSKTKLHSWIVNKMKISYKEDLIEKKPYDVKKITTSFGANLYINIEPKILETLIENNKAKFISASDRWAGSFYNKAGVKLLSKGDIKIGYEIKIMGDGSRLFTNKIFQNTDKASLLIFDQLLSHKQIESLDSPLKILEVESEVIGVVDDLEY